MSELSRRARREWRMHQLFAWVMYLALIAVTLFLCALGLRFVRPQAMIPAFSGFIILQAVVFIYADRLVNLMMRCREPDTAERTRLEACLGRILSKSGLRRAPRLYVSAHDLPNAFAYGNGLLRPYNVAVTCPLLDLLADDELDAVMAHELGHIRSRDVWAMTVVSATLGLAGLAIDAFKHIGKASFLLAIVVQVLRYLPRIVAAAISQLREYAADAFSASVTESPDALIRAFDKLGSWKADGEVPAPLFRSPVDELLLSHPNMETRKGFLRALKEKS